MIKTSVAVFRLCSVTGISLFICLQLASFLIMFAIVDVFVISGTQEKKNKNIRHNSLPMFYNGAALGASLKPNTMDSSEDAVHKLWEQSISYNRTINFNLADGGQEDAGCWLFFFCFVSAETNKKEAEHLFAVFSSDGQRCFILLGFFWKKWKIHWLKANLNTEKTLVLFDFFNVPSWLCSRSVARLAEQEDHVFTL